MTVDLRWGKRSFVEVEGLRIHVEVTDGDGPPLALLHGFTSGTFTWAGLAAELKDRPLVAWDRPPFGRSDRPPKPASSAPDPYRVEQVITEARAVLDETGAQRPVLVGHSAGCLVSLQLIAAGLDVAGLVLIAPAVEGGPPWLARTMSRVPVANRFGALALHLAFVGARPALRMMSRHSTPLTDAIVEETAQLLRGPGTADALWHLTTTWQPAVLADLVAAITPADMPIVVIGGEDDRICRPAMTRRVAEHLGVEAHMLADTGHSPHQQVPEKVAELVTLALG